MLFMRVVSVLCRAWSVTSKYNFHIRTISCRLNYELLSTVAILFLLQISTSNFCGTLLDMFSTCMQKMLQFG